MNPADSPPNPPVQKGAKKILVIEDDQKIRQLLIDGLSNHGYECFAADDGLEALKLMLKGLQNYQDPFVYFTRTLAVTVIPITLQGTVYIGERIGNIDRPGLLNFVAGLATFDEKIEKINFYQDAERELKEEAKIHLSLNSNNTRLIGIAGDPFTSETDLVFVVDTGIDESHFQSKNWSEHLSFNRLSNKTEAENLFYQGILPNQKYKKELIYASQFGLKYLIDHHL